MKDKKQTSKNLNIIIYIILIGIIISLLVDKSIIIGKEKQIIKEMTQSENESNLQTQIDALNAVQEEYALSVQTYKKQIAEAVTNQGIATSENDTGAVIATNIGKILSTKTVATATAAQILKEQTAWVNGVKVTGTMTNNGAVTKTLSAGGSYTIPAGYHNGSGKVTASTLASQTDGTATAAQILSGKTAYVDGTKVTGTMMNNGTLNWNPTGSETYTLPAGYYSGGTISTANAYNTSKKEAAFEIEYFGYGLQSYLKVPVVFDTVVINSTMQLRTSSSLIETLSAGTHDLSSYNNGSYYLYSGYSYGNVYNTTVTVQQY